MDEQARAAGTGLLAAFGIAGEIITRGGVTDRPKEPIAKPNTNGAVGSRHAPAVAPWLVALLARIGAGPWLARDVRLGPAEAKDIPGPALHRHHLADGRRLGHRTCRRGLHCRWRCGAQERRCKGPQRESRGGRCSEETRIHTGKICWAGGGITALMPRINCTPFNRFQSPQHACAVTLRLRRSRRA